MALFDFIRSLISPRHSSMGINIRATAPTAPANSNPPSSVLMAPETKPECPGCHGGLKKIPSRRTKCPHCGQFIYVKRRPDENTKKLVTKQEAQRIDVLWSQLYEKQAIEGMSATYGHNNVSKVLEELTQRFGKPPSANDLEWGLLNRQIIETKDHRGLSTIYRRMATIADSENRPSYQYLLESNRCQLRCDQANGFVKRVQISSDYCCLECAKLHGRILTPGEALKLDLLPPKECTRGFCNCGYNSVTA